jgi:hypothetical protein
MSEEMKKQVKDLDDLPVLQFLAMLERKEIVSCYNTGPGLQCFRPTTGTIHEGFPNSVLNALPYGGAYPTKLRVAKIKSMHRRGLIDGCVCGCRGDFELTDAGRAVLAASRSDLQDGPTASIIADDWIDIQHLTAEEYAAKAEQVRAWLASTTDSGEGPHPSPAHYDAMGEAVAEAIKKGIVP